MSRFCFSSGVDQKLLTSEDDSEMVFAKSKEAHRNKELPWLFPKFHDISYKTYQAFSSFLPSPLPLSEFLQSPLLLHLDRMKD